MQFHSRHHTCPSPLPGLWNFRWDDWQIVIKRTFVYDNGWNMIVETRIALDKQIEKQSKRSLIKCSKCPFDQKVIGMSYENWRVAMNRHTRISGVLACTASLVKQKKTLLPQDTLHFHLSENYKIFKHALSVVWLALFSMWCLEMGNLHSHTRWPYTKFSSKW